VGVLADQAAEFGEAALERVVEALLMSEPLAETLEARLKLPDDRELGGDRQPEGADLGRLRGRDVLVEVFDEADESVGPFPVKIVELLTGEHRETTSG
jgi:hypothetical protein